MLRPQLQPRSSAGGFLHAAVTFKPRNPFLLHPPAASSAGADAGVQLTVSDSELASRGFAVRRTAEGLDVKALNQVFARVGFPQRQEERLRRALEHSEVAWLASEATGRPVAFARAAGDGVFNAVVWDVVVEPSCQGLGLGRAVMERLVAELRRKGVGNIVLYAEPKVVGFYRPLGFALDPDGIRGMAYYRSRVIDEQLIDDRTPYTREQEYYEMAQFHARPKQSKVESTIMRILKSLSAVDRWVVAYHCRRRRMAHAERRTRRMKTRTARKEATTAPLVRSQKPWKFMQIGTQLARRFPSCATYTIAAAADAAAVTSTTIIVSPMSSSSLTPVAFGRMIPTTARGSESTRYPAATALATRKKTKVGKSSNLARNWKCSVKTESVSSEVPVEMAAASVGPKATTLSSRSTKAMQRRKPSAPLRRRNGTPPRDFCCAGAVGAAAGGGGAVTGVASLVLLMMAKMLEQDTTKSSSTKKTISSSISSTTA